MKNVLMLLLALSFSLPAFARTRFSWEATRDERIVKNPLEVSKQMEVDRYVQLTGYEDPIQLYDGEGEAIRIIRFIANGISIVLTNSMPNADDIFPLQKRILKGESVCVEVQSNGVSGDPVVYPYLKLISVADQADCDKKK